MALIRTEGGLPPELLDNESPALLQDPTLGWSDLVQGRIEMHTLPGDHLAMLSAANLPAMAAILRRLVCAATRTP